MSITPSALRVTTLSTAILILLFCPFSWACQIDIQECWIDSSVYNEKYLQLPDTEKRACNTDISEKITKIESVLSDLEKGSDDTYLIRQNLIRQRAACLNL